MVEYLSVRKANGELCRTVKQRNERERQIAEDRDKLRPIQLPLWIRLLESCGDRPFLALRFLRGSELTPRGSATGVSPGTPPHTWGIGGGAVDMKKETVGTNWVVPLVVSYACAPIVKTWRITARIVVWCGMGLRNWVLREMKGSFKSQGISAR